MLNLFDFQQEIDRNGLLSHNKYFVQIEPSASFPSSLLLLRALSLRAVNAVFPGVNLMMKDDILRYGYGPVEKSPGGALFSDVVTSFLVDSRGSVYRFFYDWLYFTASPDSSDSMSATGATGANPYEIAYKDSYVAGITISPVDDTHNTALTCVLYRAFPIAIHEIPLDASNQNSPVLLSVTWSYRDHKIV